jgi:hypothetical protein
MKHRTVTGERRPAFLAAEGQSVPEWEAVSQGMVSDIE